MHHAATRARTVSATMLASVLVAVGCRTAPASAPAGASATAAPPSATEGPATSAPPASPAAIPAREVSGSRAELQPGRYTRRGFVPRITFELDGPWHSVNALEGFFDVQQEVGTPDVIAVQFGRPEGVYSAPDRPAHVVKAAAAVDILKANRRLTTVESSSSRIAGLTGYQITVENPIDKIGDAQVMDVPPGALSISPGRRLWIAFFDTPDGLLAIMVGGSVAKWPEALASAEPVLESVTIGE